MNQKFWQPKALCLLLSLSLLTWAIFRPMSTPAKASMPAGAWQAPNAAMHPVSDQPEADSTLKFTAIAAGGYHTCGLVSGGGVKCWGDNELGQLGDGTTGQRSTPVDVVGLASDVTAIAAGKFHTCALLSGGGVKCWGYNGHGQLGDGTTKDHSKPVDVGGLAVGVKAIAAGEDHTCALGSGGGIQCWGLNGYGQLGDGTTKDHSSPVDVVGLGNSVTAIAAGGAHTCALHSGGGAKCWGYNWYGQLGDGNMLTWSTKPVDVVGLASGVTAIAAGWSHTCALDSGGGVQCWGWNGYGQVGDGTLTQRSMPVDVAGLVSGVTALAGGEYHTCALISGGGVKCWGLNMYDELGDGTLTDRSTPVDVTGLTSAVTSIAAGWSHTCGLVSGGGVKCWGWNGFGQLGDGTTMQRSTPVDVAGLARGVKTVAAGGQHTCAALSGGRVECWGDNEVGQLSDGTTTQHSIPVDVVGLASAVKAIVAGGEHTCVIVSGGGVKCWGDNEVGQLGDGTLTDHSTPVEVSGITSSVTAITAGGEHNCALLSEGGVKCWGGNWYGQLGDGTTMQRSMPVDVVGLASGVIAIAASDNHTCALVSGGGVKCWGDNEYGQLGNGKAGLSSTPVDVVGLVSGVTAIAAGGYHTCALMSGGGVKCWGWNNYGQLGDSTTTDQSTPVDVSGMTGGVTAISAGVAHTCALLLVGGVKCWGNNNSGQLGDGTLTDRSMPEDVVGLASGVTAIAAGTIHTCALVGAGHPKCWGSDEYGQLGIGTVLQHLTPVDVAGPSLTINYPTGQPGSFFTITGWNFLPSDQATLSINGQVITTTLGVNPTGSFIFFLNSSGAEPGGYAATVSGNPDASTSFRLTKDAPLRSEEGGGQVFFVPNGIALDKFIYLPLMGR